MKLCISQRVCRLRLEVCLAVALAIPSIATARPLLVSANDARIVYVGHWGPLQQGSQIEMATINSSSQIYFNFTGTHVAGIFDLRDIEYLEQIDVRVDDGDWQLFTIDQPRIEFFPQGLASGSHHLEIAVKAIDGNGDRWVPPIRSGIVFKGFELDSTATVTPGPPGGKKPFIEFLGDSITQGEGILDAGGQVIHSDGLATYAWLTGEALGSTHVQIAFGGSGVIRSGSGNVPAAPLSFAWNFAGSPADFSVVPDFILLNLGTNDQYSSDEFVPAYTKLLREIRQHCPNTVIFAMRPFHGASFHGDDIAAIVKTMNDPRIIYIDSDGWMDSGDFTDGAHPNVSGSRKAAAHLEDALRPYISRWMAAGSSN
jgi:lysophospholipase L1-like esterase